MNSKLAKSILILGIIFIWGCATTPIKQGMQQTQSQDYETAIQTFEALLETGEADSAKVMTELGITYFKMKNMDKAFPILLQSFLKDTTNTRTLFYLALIYEMKEKYPYALDMYQRYHELVKSKTRKKRIEGRIYRIARKKLQKEMRQTLADESRLNTADIKENSVAVFYFINAGNNQKLNPLQKGLTDMLITDLSKVNQLSVIERSRLQALLDEMKLSASGMTAPETSPRVGKLLGASKIIRGTYMDTGDKKFRMDAGLIRINSNQPMTTTSVQGDFLKLFQLEKDLVFKVIDEMNIQLSQTERDAIEIIPTENILAFMAYCKGLDYEDRGMFPQAIQSFNEAVKRDPKFEKARQNITKVQNINAASSDIAEFESLVIEDSDIETQEDVPETQIAEDQTSTMPDENLISQMIHVSEFMTQTFLPGVESREPVQEQNATSFGSSTTINLIIPIPQEVRR